jgi:hypothetical protein
MSTEIGPIVGENFNFIKSLAKTRSKRKRKRLLKQATTAELLSISEICLNLVRQRFLLTTRQKRRIFPYADFVRRMSRVRSERGAKQIVQKGNGLGLGLFPAILTPIILEIARSILVQEKPQTIPST